MAATPDKVRRIVRGASAGILLLATVTLFSGCLLFPRRPGNLLGGSPSGSGRIDGLITGERGQGLTGVSVVIPEAGQLTAVTGADGRFTLAGLPAGEYYLLTRKEGYLNGAYAVQVGSGAQAPFAAEALPVTGNLHQNSARVPNLCGECHLLHDPTSAEHLINGPSKNTPCFVCHAPGKNRGFSEANFRNSPHGPAWVPDAGSPVQFAWTGQAASERGNCIVCHEPHGMSGPPFMLRKGSQAADGTLSLNVVCYECHTAAGVSGKPHTAGWPGRTVYEAASNRHAAITDPSLSRKYAPGECGICHTPHGQSTSYVNAEAMLRDQQYKVCVKCHPGKAVSDSGHGNCVMCHDPHRAVKSGTTVYVKDPLNPNGPLIVAPKESWRGGTWISGTAYCLKCHSATPPAGLSPTPRNPYAGSTKFWNQTALSDRNLHNVHVNKIMPGYREHEGGVTGDLNKVKCGQCHTVHQNGGSRNFNTGYVRSFTSSYSGNYAQKNGCDVGGGCHSCGWCHNSPGSPASPCYNCDWHGWDTHPTVNY